MEMNRISALKVDAWPEPDRRLWLEARQAGGVFDDGGFAARWSPATCRLVEHGYGAYLAWLDQTGNLDPTLAPIDRVDEIRVRQFLMYFGQGRAALTVAGAIRGVAYMVRATAPPDGLPWLTRLAHRLTNTAEPARPKPPRMATIQELLDLGVGLMRVGQSKLEKSHVRGAVDFRDGLMIASLATRPLRRRNLADMKVGKTFFIDAQRACVRFAGEDTKTGVELDVDYPDWLLPMFRHYLSDVRPVLLRKQTGEDSGWLWIGRRGCQLHADLISITVTRATKRHLGKPVSPHMFRDCAATDIAYLDSEHVGITKDILGHAVLSTSQKYYNQATSAVASKKHRSVIAALRS